MERLTDSNHPHHTHQLNTTTLVTNTHEGWRLIINCNTCENVCVRCVSLCELYVGRQLYRWWSSKIVALNVWDHFWFWELGKPHLISKTKSNNESSCLQCVLGVGVDLIVSVTYTWKRKKLMKNCHFDKYLSWLLGRFWLKIMQSSLEKFWLLSYK